MGIYVAIRLVAVSSLITGVNCSITFKVDVLKYSIELVWGQMQPSGLLCILLAWRSCALTVVDAELEAGIQWLCFLSDVFQHLVPVAVCAI